MKSFEEMATVGLFMSNSFCYEWKEFALRSYADVGLSLLMVQTICEASQDFLLEVSEINLKDQTK